MKRYVSLVVVSVFCYLALSFFGSAWQSGLEPAVSAELAVKTVNGGTAEFVAQRAYEQNKSSVETLFSVLKGLSLALAVFAVVMIVRNKKNVAGSQSAVALALVALSLGFTGCTRQPYNTPKFVDVETHQTAYVIPLADTKKQEKFDSADLEAKKQVAVRKIQVPHEWVQTGRQFWYQTFAPGEYRPTIKVIIVDRSPLMREWSSDPQNLGGGKPDGVNVEAGDSIGFSLGFKVVAFIAEEDTTTFLYMNPSGSLASVMDSEILTRIQKVAAAECAKYPMDVLRTKKAEIYAAIDADVVPFFKKRGITIPTIAQLGGIVYDNHKIQESIDQTVVDQQLKVSAIAKAAAQVEENKRIESEATAKANAARSLGQATADAAFYVQKATADGIREVAKATSEAQSGDAFIRLKELEVALEWAKHSTGQVPQFVMQGASGSNQPPVNFLMSMPPEFVKPNSKAAPAK